MINLQVHVKNPTTFNCICHITLLHTPTCSLYNWQVETMPQLKTISLRSLTQKTGSTYIPSHTDVFLCPHAPRLRMTVISLAGAIFTNEISNFKLMY